MSRRSVKSLSPSKKTMESGSKIRNRKQDYHKILLPVDIGGSDIRNSKTGSRADRISKEGENKQDDKQSRKSVGGKQLKSDIEMNDQKFRSSKQSKGEETAQTDKESRKIVKPEKQKSKESQMSEKKLDASSTEGLSFKSYEIEILEERGITNEEKAEERKNARFAGKMRHLLIAGLVAFVFVIIIISVAVTQTTASKKRKITSKTAANIGEDVSDSTPTTTVTTSITSPTTTVTISITSPTTTVSTSSTKFQTTTQPPLPPSCDFETNDCGITVTVTDQQNIPLISSSPGKFDNFGRANISDIQIEYNINLTKKGDDDDVYSEYVFFIAPPTLYSSAYRIQTEFTGTLLKNHCVSIDIYARRAHSTDILIGPNPGLFRLNKNMLLVNYPENMWFTVTVEMSHYSSFYNRPMALQFRMRTNPGSKNSLIFLDNIVYAPCH